MRNPWLACAATPVVASKSKNQPAQLYGVATVAHPIVLRNWKLEGQIYRIHWRSSEWGLCLASAQPGRIPTCSSVSCRFDSQIVNYSCASEVLCKKLWSMDQCLLLMWSDRDQHFHRPWSWLSWPVASRQMLRHRQSRLYHRYDVALGWINCAHLTQLHCGLLWIMGALIIRLSRGFDTSFLRPLLGFQKFSLGHTWAFNFQVSCTLIMYQAIHAFTALVQGNSVTLHVEMKCATPVVLWQCEPWPVE